MKTRNKEKKEKEKEQVKVTGKKTEKLRQNDRKID